MLKKIIIYTLILLSSASVFSQVEDKLIGKWIYKDVFNRSLLNEETLAAVDSEDSKSMFFHFNDDGTYKSHLLAQKAEGKWILTEDQESCVLKTETSSIIIEIITISDNELALRVGGGEYLLSKQVDNFN